MMTISGTHTERAHGTLYVGQDPNTGRALQKALAHTSVEWASTRPEHVVLYICSSDLKPYIHTEYRMSPSEARTLGEALLKASELTEPRKPWE
jgi:hypothetical protein